MNITIKVTGGSLTEAVQSLVEKKFSGLQRMTKHDPGALLECEIEQSVAVERTGGKYRAEGNLSVQGKLFRAEAVSTTLEGAIDVVRNDLQRVLRDDRGKKQSFLKRGGAKVKRMFQRGS